MSEDEEAECWECGLRPAYECSQCDSGEEYCGECMSNHIALEHDEDSQES